MNRQVNPDHCYATDDGVVYMLEKSAERDSPEWHVLKDGRRRQTFTSLYAAKCWLEHVLEHGEQTSLKPRVIVAGGGKAKLAAARDRDLQAYWVERNWI